MAEIVEPVSPETAAPRPAQPRPAPRMRLPLSAAIRSLREGRAQVGGGFAIPGMGFAESPVPPITQGARFEARAYSGPAGARDYKLYVPAKGKPRGLILMLHGCKQNPDDFATGTAMNTHAETHGLLVVYPRQGAAENAASCWNWFVPAHQTRDGGEPEILAGITREVLAEFDLKPGQVFAAGLSAGGAMAAVLGATHPDLFAAVGIHSGLPHGAANDVMSAFAAMRGDSPPNGALPANSDTPPTRTIVFHGTADRTVHPANGAQIAAAAQAALPGAKATEETGTSESGVTYTRNLVHDARGRSMVEHWEIGAAGHAWSGGAPAGSYTDPSGPDASAEMLRFFLDDAAPAKKRK